MGKINSYTLFYRPADGALYKGTCREEKEVLVDIAIGEKAEIGGYRGDGMNLYLNGFEFETTADIGLVLPEGAKLVLEGGTSKIVIHAKGPEANVAGLYVKGDMEITGGDGTLLIDTTSTTKENCLWSRCICVRYGDLTVSGGKIKAACGQCSVRAGAVYAGGRLFGGDAQKGAITINGGEVIAAAAPHTIRATENELTIGAGSVVENSGEFAGSDKQWHGSYLAQRDADKPLRIAFA